MFRGDAVNGRKWQSALGIWRLSGSADQASDSIPVE